MPKRSARFGIGKNDLSCALQKNQNRQTVENLALGVEIRAFRED